MSEEIKQGMTRREVLKKGALFGGTLMWVAPVVQAVGMSPAMAKIPSETSCCLKMVSLTAAIVGSQVNIELTVQNCSTVKTDIFVTGGLERLEVVSSVPVESTKVSLPNFFVGSLGSALTDTDGYNESVGLLVSGKTYVYRSHGTYDCYESDESGVLTLVAPGLNHNVPSAYWVYSNSVTIPIP